MASGDDLRRTRGRNAAERFVAAGRRDSGNAMTIVVAPTAARAPTPPAVGIFWRVKDALVVDRSTLDEAEPYGDCLTHPVGHYDRWEEWQTFDAAHLEALGYPGVIASSEYDDWPRGRVVYERSVRYF